MHFFHRTLNFCGNQSDRSRTDPLLQILIACCYHFVDDCFIFLSDKTHAKIQDADIFTKEGAKAKINFVINF